MKLKITKIEGATLPDDPGIRMVDRGRVTIGRGEDCTWCLPDPERLLSKRHCEVMFQGTVFVLKDTSTNGVYVNDSTDPVGRGKTVVLKHGDTFRAADFVFKVDLVGAEIDPFADAAVQPAGGGAATANPSKARRSFVDPGSPIEQGGFGAGGDDPFDAFGGSFDDPAEADAFSAAGDSEWGRAPDWAGDDGVAEAADGFGGDWSESWSGDDGPAFGSGIDNDYFAPSQPETASFGEEGGFPPDADDARDWPLADGAAPDGEPFAGLGDEPAASSPVASPIPGPASSPNPSPDRMAAVAATLVETLLVVGRRQEAMASALGITSAAKTPDFPPVSGATLIAQLMKLPDDQGVKMIGDLSRAVENQAETLAQALEAGGGVSREQPLDDSASGGAGFGDDPFNAGPFDEDPFS